MNPAELKKKYRGRLALWGGIDNQEVLPRGSVAEVKRAVEQCLETLGEGGGYVFSSCHNIQPDVPPENIVAMFDHAASYRPSYQT